jgi:sugar lactone lactonase YvrE
MRIARSLFIARIMVACFLFACARGQADVIYVANVGYGTHSIRKFDLNGNGSVFIGPSGVGAPQGLALDAAGNLFVAEYQDSIIRKFDSNGTGTVFATTGVSAPEGIAFDKAGNLYVANSGNNTIQKFDPSGHGTVFAGPSSGLDAPIGLAFDSNGNLFVANWGNKILKFDSNGTGTVFTTSNLNNPFGIAIDSHDNIYVSNWSTPAIEKFDSAGHGTVFANWGLFHPDGLAFDSAGNLYVANQASNNVVKFDSKGNGSIFASGIDAPEFVFVQVAEPTNNASAFRITSIAVTGSDVLVKWNMGSGKTNVLQATTGDANNGFTNTFSDLFVVANTAGTTTNYLDAGAVTNFPSRYYRVRLVP